MLDPPTSDVTARVVTLLAKVGRPQDAPALERALAYLRAEQEPDGAWFGRWGTNYIYGTWSVLIALEQAGVAHDDPAVRRAANWLASKQNADGGWGELNHSYHDRHQAGGPAASAPFQSAWALLALLAAGEVDSVGGAQRRALPAALAAEERTVERPAFHGAGLSARLLSQVPRLLRVLSAVGAGRLSQSRGRHPPQVSLTGIVAALTAEARTLGPLQPGPRPDAAASFALHTLADGNLLAVSGMGPDAARRASAALIAAGAQGLLSFGLAGALDPPSAPARCCCPRR